jgi:hypothetical protein
MISRDNLNSFLLLGYFLKYPKNELVPIPQNNSELFYDFDEEELIKYGCKILIDAISEKFKNDSMHLVPLSGGYDSRAILACLLEFTHPENIQTFTYGVPGSFDYEIGKRISREVGVNNFEINLQVQRFSTEMLIQTSKRFNNQTFLFYHPDYDIIHNRYGDYYYWSGFLGGESAGSHYQNWENEKTSLNHIKREFLNRNRYVKSIYLADKPIDSLMPLLNEVNLDIENISRYEKIDFYNRQTKYIAPHVCPQGFNIIAPFSSKTWLNFICSIPKKYRYRVMLYEKILYNAFPSIFSLPTKNKYGLSLKSNNIEFLIRRIQFKAKKHLGFNKFITNKNLNYFDFGRTLRNDVNLRKVVSASINDLSKRALLSKHNPNQILTEHLKCNNNFGDAIQILASLEIILKAKGE